MADDLDFELEGIDLNSLDDAGKKMYENLNKQFKGAYTKKTQALSDDRKKWETEKAALAQEAQQYKGEIDQFNNWWASLTPDQQNYYQNLTPGQQREVTGQMGLTRPEESMADYQDTAKEFKELRDWGQREFDGLKQRQSALETSMPLFMDAVDFRFKHPEADWKKVMARAQKEGIRNFDLAYKMEYGEEDEKKRVEDEVTRRLGEEKEKLRSESKIPEFAPGNPLFTPTETGKPAKDWTEASGRFMEGFKETLGKPV